MNFECVPLRIINYISRLQGRPVTQCEHSGLFKMAGVRDDLVIFSQD